jgi:small multidrug resistance pump
LAYLLLAFAIGIEVAATSLLKSTDGFTKPLPTAVCLLGYATAFVLLSRIVKEIPVGVAYAVWSGMGTVLVVTIGILFLGEAITFVKIAGIAAVVAGVVVLNLGGAH